MTHHPNMLPFCGVVTCLDTVSDRAVIGALGHRVVMTRAAAEAALPTLLGMAVSFKDGWNGHDARQKVGIVTDAQIAANQIIVEGYIFACDFPEVEARSSEGRYDEAQALGMSWEIVDAHVLDFEEHVWTLDRVTFTGATILLRSRAAFRDTAFSTCRLGC